MTTDTDFVRSPIGNSNPLRWVGRTVSSSGSSIALGLVIGARWEDLVTHVDELRRAVEDATPKLLALGEKSAVRPGPRKWSPREIIGHLIDSASNNHQRFVRGQLQDDLVFPGYAQEDWVRIGQYADAPWDELVALWRNFNLQLARVMSGTPVEIRRRPLARHSLEAIGVSVPAGEPPCLDHIMSDYVAHLNHHLLQIVAMRAPPR